MGLLWLMDLWLMDLGLMDYVWLMEFLCRRRYLCRKLCNFLALALALDSHPNFRGMVWARVVGRLAWMGDSF